MFQTSAKLKTSRFLSHLWILEVKSGLVLFEQNYSSVIIDVDLVAGFLNAMRNFGHEIAHGEIQEISFNNMRFSMALGKFVLVVCTTTEQATKSGIKALLDVILFEFEHQFQRELVKWMGNCDPFQPFGDFIANLINKKPVKATAPLIHESSKIEESNSSVSTERPSEAVERLVRQMQKKHKSTWFGTFVRKKVIDQYTRELKNPARLVKILTQRERLRHEKHVNIERQTRWMHDKVDEELARVILLPESRLMNLLQLRDRSDETVKIRKNKEKSKKVKKIKDQIRKSEEHIRKLQDDLAKLS